MYYFNADNLTGINVNSSYLIVPFNLLMLGLLLFTVQDTAHHNLSPNMLMLLVM